MSKIKATDIIEWVESIVDRSFELSIENYCLRRKVEDSEEKIKQLEAEAKRR